MSKNNCNKFLVVLYKTAPTASPTIQSTINFFSSIESTYRADCELLIWDNSPTSHAEDVDALRLNSPLNVSFVHTPQNTSLSKIYNTVASDLADGDYLTLLDQDSILPSEYFIELRRAQLEGHPLILPKVECGGLLVSPGTRFFCKGKLLPSINAGLISSKNLLAINSGMSARGKVFKLIPYDERLMFYGTDTYFMKQYEKYFAQAYVINATLNHSLAENDVITSVERKQQIAEARHNAWAIVFSETITERIFLWAYQHALQLRRWLNN